MNFKQAFSALSEHEQALLLAAYGHELTVVARGTYEVGSDGVVHPQVLRRLNEIQHRVTSAIRARLCRSPNRYPDDVLMDIIVSSGTDPFSESLYRTFKRVWTSVFGKELENDEPGEAL
jgi:hypothetical protein